MVAARPAAGALHFGHRGGAQRDISRADAGSMLWLGTAGPGSWQGADHHGRADHPFVGYQLWGTGLTEQRQQRALAAEFSERLGASPPPADTPVGETPGTTGPTGAGDVPTLSEPVPRPHSAAGTGAALGEAVAQLEIPQARAGQVRRGGCGRRRAERGAGPLPGHGPPRRVGQRGDRWSSNHLRDETSSRLRDDVTVAAREPLRRLPIVCPSGGLLR